MACDCVFIASLGDSDVQVLHESAEGPKRYRMLKDTMRSFHQFYLDQLDRFEVAPLRGDPAVANVLDGREAGTLRFVVQGPWLDIDRPADGAPEGPTLDCGPGKRVRLCLPILSKAVADLNALQSRGQVGAVRCAVLFYTRRENVEANHREPIAVADIAGPAVARTFGLSDDLVDRVCILQGQESLHVHVERTGERHLLPAAAARIDAAIRRAANRGEDLAAAIVDVAGLPDTKGVLLASCRYRFGEDRWHLVRPVDDRRRLTTVAYSHVIDPQESLETRRRVMQLVRDGDFDGAAAVANVDPNAGNTEPWRWRIRKIARLLNGEQIEVRGAGEVEAILEKVRDDHMLTAAFRVENALRRADYISALCETVHVAEALLIQLADRYLLTKDGGSCVDWGSTDDPWSTVRIHFDRLEGDSRFDTNEPTTNKGVREEVRKLLEQNHRGAAAAFKDFSSRLDRSGARYFRNIIVHAGLKPAKLDAARERMHRHGLWDLRKRHPFLDVPVVASILTALGTPDSVKIYDRLIAAIQRDMDENSFRECTR